eukprot:7109852-Prymnesium_polylepis.2
MSQSTRAGRARRGGGARQRRRSLGRAWPRRPGGFDRAARAGGRTGRGGGRRPCGRSASMRAPRRRGGARGLRVGERSERVEAEACGR